MYAVNPRHIVPHCCIQYFCRTRTFLSIRIEPRSAYFIFFFKIYRWHHAGEEFFILAKDNMSYQINNGIKLSELTSFEAKDYKIGFHKTNNYESSICGKIYFYRIDPDTKLVTIILDSTLEIALEEYKLLEENYLQLTQKPSSLFDFNLN